VVCVYVCVGGEGGGGGYYTYTGYAVCCVWLYGWSSHLVNSIHGCGSTKSPSDHSILGVENVMGNHTDFVIQPVLIQICVH